MTLDSSSHMAPMPQPEVFDADNPPKRMSQMIRLSIRDVEAMLAQGYGYDWTYSSLKASADHQKLPSVTTDCAACHTGAILLRLSGDPETKKWSMFGPVWNAAFKALSYLTWPLNTSGCIDAYNIWPEGFYQAPNFSVAIPDASTNWPAHKAAMLELADWLEAEGS